MNDIEQLVRDALHDAPSPETHISDPVATLQRRVRRARAMIGSSVIVGAMVIAAAVVVPMQLSGGRGTSNVQVTNPSPSPAPTLTTDARGVTVWQKSDAVAVTAGGGWLWELTRNPGANDGSGYVVKVDPKTHEQLAKWDVKAPFDFMAYGLDRVWVWGGGDGGYPDGQLQVVDPSKADSAHWPTLTNPHQNFAGVAFLSGSAWAATGKSVWQISPDGVVATRNPIGATAQVIAATTGKLWVDIGQSNIDELEVQGNGGNTMPLGARVTGTTTTADATEHLLAATDSTHLLLTFNTLLTLSDASDPNGLGPNATLPGAASAAAMLPDGSVAVAVAGDESGSRQGGVYWWAHLNNDSQREPPTYSSALEGANAVSLVASPAGGFELVLDDGTAEHWQPAR